MVVMSLREIVVQFRQGFLGEEPSAKKCFTLSSALAGYLHFAGIECTMVKGQIKEYEHFWINLSDGRIVDATADQFQKPNGETMPKVYIGRKPKWYKLVEVM